MRSRKTRRRRRRRKRRPASVKLVDIRSLPITGKAGRNYGASCFNVEHHLVSPADLKPLGWFGKDPANKYFNARTTLSNMHLRSQLVGWAAANIKSKDLNVTNCNFSEGERTRTYRLSLGLESRRHVLSRLSHSGLLALEPWRLLFP